MHNRCEEKYLAHKRHAIALKKIDKDKNIGFLSHFQACCCHSAF
jgi:hypothetical protein